MINYKNSRAIKNTESTRLIDQKLELTPLIDVIFIVIVFLLLTANVRLLSLPITVPETDDIAEASSSDPSVITVSVSHEDSGWHLEKSYFSQWELFRAELLRVVKEKPGSPVILAADQKADVQRFVRVLTLLQQQQIVDTRIIVNKL